MGTARRKTSSSLVVADLIPDAPLQSLVGKRRIDPTDDLLQHRVLAAEVAQLALTVDGRLNIAVFGPWGAGKSSFFGLLQQEIEARGRRRKIVTFNAWENAGKDFHANFLSAIAGPDSKIDRELYESSRTVKLPMLSGKRWWRAALYIGGLVLLFVALLLAFPLIPTGIEAVGGAANFDFGAAYLTHIPKFFAIPIGGTLLAAVVALIVELGKVTVEQSAPSHISEFRKLFRRQVGRTNHVIFIDELDRCGPDDVMLTLEGLRTFLDHPRCVFVVAFDRDAVSATIAANSRNARSERSPAYYRTSGEYLDKVFQFQVSLPPQHGHVTRGFARKLVIDRGGVWKDLRDAGPEVLDRVVSILSPIHVTSPRRAKVLLNDFAVNARTYQDLEFNWVERAEEIAVLSVIKTEFPYFAADLEREPMLLDYLAGDREPTRPTLLRRRDAYRKFMTEPGDEDDGPIFEDVVVSSATGDGTDRTSADRVNRALARQLQQYLVKLRDERYALPKADIILMRNEPDLGGFEDGALHGILLLAGEAGRDETVEAIRLASEADQGRAIGHLLRRIEESPSPEWSIGLLNVALDVVRTAPAIPPEAAGRLRQRWTSSADHADLAERLTSTALRGIARLTVDAFARPAVEGLMTRTAAVGEGAVTAVVDEMLDRFTAEQLAECAPALLDLISARGLEPATASRALTRIGTETRASLTEAQIERLAIAYSPPDEPAEEPPAPASRAVTAEREAQLQAARDAHNQQAAEDFADLIADWDALPTGRQLRGALLSALRRVDPDSAWALELHDARLVHDRDTVAAEVAGDEALDAIIDLPELAEVRWLDLLPAGVGLDRARSGAAIAATVAWALDEPDADGLLDDAVTIVTAIRAACPSPLTGEATLAEVTTAVEPTEAKTFTEAALGARIALVDALDGLPAVDAAAHWAGLVQWALATATPEAALQRAIDLIDSAADSRVDLLAARLGVERNERDLTAPEVRAMIRLQLRQVARGIAIDHLAWVDVAETIPTTALDSIAPEWLRTGPAADEVEAAADVIALSIITNADWSAWSKLVTPADRAVAWRLSSNTGLPATTLTLIIADGPSADLYDQVAKQLTVGASIGARRAGLTDFGTLPTTPDKARVAMAALATLQGKARGVDGPLAHEILATVASVLTSVQKIRAKTALAMWPNARISGTVRSSLETAGILESRNPLKRLIGRGRKKK